MSCVKVEVVVLGSPSLIVRTISVDVKQHWIELASDLFQTTDMASYLAVSLSIRGEVFADRRLRSSNCFWTARSVEEVSTKLEQHFIKYVLLKASLTNSALPDVWTLSYIYEGVAVWARARRWPATKCEKKLKNNQDHQ